MGKRDYILTAILFVILLFGLWLAQKYLNAYMIRILNIVVFPAPLGPINPAKSPS
jgi:uncharacterized membrane protein YccF (DUF307 family)